MHGNKPFGFIVKRNFYTSLADVLQDKRPNTPVNNLCLTKKSLNALNSFRTDTILRELGEISESFNNEFRRVCLSLLVLAEKDGVLRAEFRINHRHIASMVPQLARKFASQSVLDLIIPFKSSTISKLATFYTTMLSEPILTLLCHLPALIELGKFQEINGTLASLSAFENLFTYSFLSGRTNTYVRELVWSQGNETRTNSLQLMRSIYKYNRPVFPANLFNTNSKQFTAASDTVFNEMCRRFGTSIQQSLKTMELIIPLRSNTLSNERKAFLLWENYYSELPADDFRDPNLDRWKYNSLKLNEVSFGSVMLTTSEAVEIVFPDSSEYFESISWNRPYYKAFQLWREEFPSLNHAEILSAAASSNEMKIEIIRYHSTPSRFLSNGRRFMRISNESNNIIPSQVDPIAARGALMLNNAVQLNNNRVVTRKRRIPFTLEEEIALLRGINTFGLGKWKEILLCPDLSFNNARDNIDLKDKYRNLESRVITETANIKSNENEVIYYLDGLRSQCLRPCSITEKQKPSKTPKRSRDNDFNDERMNSFSWKKTSVISDENHQRARTTSNNSQVSAAIQNSSQSLARNRENVTSLTLESVNVISEDDSMSEDLIASVNSNTQRPEENNSDAESFNNLIAENKDNSQSKINISNIIEPRPETVSSTPENNGIHRESSENNEIITGSSADENLNSVNSEYIQNTSRDHLREICNQYLPGKSGETILNHIVNLPRDGNNGVPPSRLKNNLQKKFKTTFDDLLNELIKSNLVIIRASKLYRNFE